MCGICGALFVGAPDRQPEATLRTMSATLTHRGPDGAGVWVSEAGEVALGHQRLSIIDLSETGRQPMESASGRYVITYNGEIYNFGALRQELTGTGHTWRGTSDTEVLLAAIDRWGIEEATRRCVGMFAFAVWDR